MSQKPQGLLLILGGAPTTPHVLEGLPGYYCPDVPHPVGDDCDLSLQEGKTAVKERPDVLKLVDIADLKDAQEVHAAAIAAGRNERRAARKDGRAADDPSRTKDEHDAVKEA